MIYLGFRYEKYSSLFYVGIGATILNIIVQLSDFWSSVPLPVYLLLSGLAIIGYVTYKEISKSKKKDVKEAPAFVDDTQVDVKALVFNIVLLVVTLISIFFNAYNINKQEEIKLQKEREQALLEKGYDPEKVYVDDKYKYIFIVEGNHYDLKKLIDTYKEFDQKDYSIKDYDRYYDDYIYKDYYYHYSVVYLTKENFKKIKKAKYDSYYNYYNYDSSNYFYYDGNVSKNYYVNGVDVTVENELINYVEEEYSYSSNSKRTLTLKYNTYDVDALKLKFKGVNNRKVTITTSDNETYVLENDGTHNISSKNGKITITVYDTELDINKEIEDYYSRDYNY